MSVRGVLMGLLVVGLGVLAVPAWFAHRYDIAPSPVHLPDDGLLGPIRIMPAFGRQDGPVVYLLSGADGWDARSAGVARRLVHAGVTVLGLDLKELQDGIKDAGGDCVDPSWALQDVSHTAQRALGLKRYQLPVLVGTGAGAGMAAALAATGTPAILGGAVAVDPVTVTTPRPLCIDPQGDQVPVVRPGGSGRPGQRLVAEMARRVGAKGDDSLSDLPLVELQAPLKHKTLAIVYSGDGGWRDLDKQVGEYLQGQGVPTVGVDMLRYYWAWRSPEDSAADLSRLIAHYRKVWGAEKVLLIGYSFGADVMPALYNLLPADQQDHVVQISLLALSANANFEVTVGEFLNSSSESTQPTKPDLDKITPAKLQCFEGKDDPDGVCHTLEGAGTEVVFTAGGHHFDGEYTGLAEKIVEGLVKRTGQ